LNDIFALNFRVRRLAVANGFQVVSKHLTAAAGISTQDTNRTEIRHAGRAASRSHNLHEGGSTLKWKNVRSLDRPSHDDALTGEFFDKDRHLGILQIVLGQLGRDLGGQLFAGQSRGLDNANEWQGNLATGADPDRTIEIRDSKDLDFEQVLGTNSIVSRRGDRALGAGGRFRGGGGRRHR